MIRRSPRAASSPVRRSAPASGCGGSRSSGSTASPAKPASSVVASASMPPRGWSTILVSVVIWMVAAIVAFHLLDIDPAFFLSSAGFIGAGLAIGGQHKVNDYLTGLSVHFEDRYGVGDEIVVDVGWSGAGPRRRRPRRPVQHPGARRAQHAALPEPRARRVSGTCPRRRRPRRSDCGCRTSADAGDAAADVARAGGTDGLTDVVFVGDLDSRQCGRPARSRSMCSHEPRRSAIDRCAIAWSVESNRALSTTLAAPIARFSWQRRGRHAAQRPAGAGSPGAPLRRAHPRSPSPGWCRARSRGNRLGDRALGADLFGVIDRDQRLPRGADREEQIRVGVATQGVSHARCLRRRRGRAWTRGSTRTETPRR